MWKHLVFSGFVAVCLVANPARADEAEANRLLIEAIALAEQATRAPADEALALYRQAADRLDAIVAEHPESALAIAIATNQPIGAFRPWEVRHERARLAAAALTNERPSLDEPSALTAPAAEFPGADDPAFHAALTIWLQGDDAAALPQIAALANEDNLAAQLFLGAIEDRRMTLTPWVSGLGREEYNAIFRRMDSRFGTKWFRVAEDAGSQLAALLTFPQVDDRYSADHALGLAALGEPRATAQHLNVLINQGLWAEAVRLEPIAALYGMQPMAWAAATYLPAPAAPALRAAGHAALGAGTMNGYAFIQLANRENPEFAAVPDETMALARQVTLGRGVGGDAPALPPEATAILDDWLATATEARLLRRWCAAGCPEAQQAACAGDLYALMGGRGALPLMESSPLETLIPQEVWVATRRALMVLEFYAVAIARSAPEPEDALARLPLQACVKDGLADALGG